MKMSIALVTVSAFAAPFIAAAYNTLMSVALELQGIANQFAAIGQ